MTAKELINISISPLKTSDTGNDALKRMCDYKVSHLPIVNNEVLLGVISEKDIYDFDELDKPIGAHTLSITNAQIYEWQHIFEVIKQIEKQRLTLIPVLDKNDKYLGSIVSSELIFKIASLFMLEKPGAMVIFEMGINDYSLTEISNIVESNNAKILSSSVIHKPDSERINLIIKLNTTEINSILKTFERYEYIVKAVYDENTDNEGLKERYDMLMKYLNV